MKINQIPYQKTKLKNKIRKLYNESFPDDERVPFNILVKLLDDKNVEFLSFEDEKTLYGLVFNILYKDIVYVFYLAVNPSLRNQGYGSYILQAVKQRYKESRIILMIEEVNEKYDNFEERKNRLRFYENNGFHRFGYLHHEYRVDYEMLGMGEYVSREEYIELMYSVFPKERYDYAMNLY